MQKLKDGSLAQIRVIRGDLGMALTATATLAFDPGQVINLSGVLMIYIKGTNATS